MQCPYCNHVDSKVIDSRESGDGIRRRRECSSCELRYTTTERVQTRVLMIIKQDNRREEYDREKLWNSLTKACAKRPLPIGTIDKVVEDVEATLTELGRAEIPSKDIGALVMDKLKNLDRVSYIRFASVYRDFRDIQMFKNEIEALLEPPEPSSVPQNQLSFLEDEKIMPQPRRRGRPPKSAISSSDEAEN